MIKLEGNNPALRYGLIILAVILWHVILLHPLAKKISSLKTQLQAESARIERLKKDLKQLRDVDKKLQRARNSLDKAMTGLVPGDTPQLVASSLQDLLLKKAAELNVEVVTYKTGPVRKWKDYHLAVVTFTLNTDTRKLVQFLQSLQEEDKLYRIQGMNILHIRGKGSHLRVRLEFEALCV